MPTREKPICLTARTFIRHHLGKHCLAPLTGQDARALSAFAHLMELYCVADTRGRETALVALRATVLSAQKSVWPLFRKCIPHSLDWSDEYRLWEVIMSGEGS